MVRLITELDEFFNSEFESISLGLTPSGNLHLGFLVTLACAFIYLREHPKTSLTITTLENTLDAAVDKYNNMPIRFQNLGENGKLEVPENLNIYNQKKLISSKITAELKDLVWKLVQIFDNKTKEEIKKIQALNIPKEHKKNLEKKENTIYHIFSNNIYIYSLLNIIETNKSFKREMTKLFTDPKSITILNDLRGLDKNIQNYGKIVHYNKKEYQPKFMYLPIRLFCPECKNICNEWCKLILGHPEFQGPKFLSFCKNFGKCNIAENRIPVIVDPKNEIEKVEFYFMLGVVRDFFKPFKADCRIFGGDYFQLKSKVTQRSAVDRLIPIVEYLEKIKNQNKAFFGGPLILMDGEKMSKTNKSFKIKDIENITKTFLEIIKKIEGIRKNKSEMKIEYKDVLPKKAA